MNLSSIKKGERIPNYKALCKLLEEDIKSGASKRSQLKIWEQFFSYKRDKNAYIITDIYEEPHNIEDGRMTFMKYSAPMVLYYFCQLIECEIYELDFTIKNWLIETKMIPLNILGEEMNNTYEFPHPFSHLEVQYVKNNIYSTAKEIFMRSLSHLKKIGVINFKETIYKIENEKSEVGEVEKEYLKEVQKRVLEELGVKNMFAVFMSQNKTTQYYERTKEIYRDEKGWESVFNLISVEIVDIDYIKKYKDLDIKKYQKNLFDEIEKSIVKKVKSSKEKFIEQDWESKSFYLNPMQASGIEFILEETL